MSDTTAITNDQDVIDSRDVIARIEHLSQLRQPGPVDLGDDNDVAQDDLFHELAALEALAAEASQYAVDWEYGEALIRDSYFEDYARELAEDCAPSMEAVEMIRNDGRGEYWPLTFTTIDWQAATDALRQDYTSVDFDGVTYWVR